MPNFWAIFANKRSFFEGILHGGRERDPDADPDLDYSEEVGPGHG